MDVTHEGKELIDRWRNTQKYLREAQEKVKKAELEVDAARDALGKWLTPDDARNGETFCVWYGDSLITAAKNQNSYGVEIRKRGKSLLV